MLAMTRCFTTIQTHGVKTRRFEVEDFARLSILANVGRNGTLDAIESESRDKEFVTAVHKGERS